MMTRKGRHNPNNAEVAFVGMFVMSQIKTLNNLTCYARYVAAGPITGGDV